MTPPHSMAAILPQWGGVTPFLLTSRSGLEWKGPPAVASAEFAREFDEVKTLGARNSTADQTAAAVFWTVQTAMPWHAAARAAATSKGLGVADTARLFAILSMATADSQIVAFAEKYKNPHWRPITAIRGAGALGIPAVKADPRCWARRRIPNIPRHTPSFPARPRPFSPGSSKPMWST